MAYTKVGQRAKGTEGLAQDLAQLHGAGEAGYTGTDRSIKGSYQS